MTCNLCPRQCNINRDLSVGFCGAPNKIVVAKSMLHRFEEPVISGKNGSGAIFFSGCNLRCCYCQNRDISAKIMGKIMDENEFYSLLVSLAKSGAHNINLITATPYVHLIIPALKRFKNEYRLPIIYNCSGYESVETLKSLEGIIDVYLPDFKYYDSVLANNFSNAKNYPTIAIKAIGEMLRQQPKVEIENSLIKRGVIIRHLVLPAHVDDSIKIVEYIASNFNGAYLSLMSQYTPSFDTSCYKELKRRLTGYEYNKVLLKVRELDLEGFCQDKSSATDIYTPDFKNSD